MHLLYLQEYQKHLKNITAQEDDTSINQFGDMNEVNQSQGNDSEMVQGNLT